MGKKEESLQLEKKGAVDVGKYDVDEHVLSVEEVAKRYATRVDVVNVAKSQGLSKAEAEERLSKNGPNALTPPKTLPEWLKYLKQYTNPLLMLLIVACILSFVAYAIQTEKDLANIYIGSTLFVVVFVLATEAYRNERAATKAANALRSLLPSVTNVIRDGQESQEHAANLVVGDVVHLLIGTRVPADIKIIEAKDLKLDFSSLTGEADPIPMSAVAKHDAPHESHNIAFMSSQVLNGEGRGIVIRCGDATFIGNINTLTAGTATQETTLVKDIRIFVTFIAVVALTMAIILFGVGLGRGFKFADAFVNGLVVVLVANIPQGLPATVTAMLSSCAMKMKEKRVVAKRSDIVEALGAASRIASDKTGTLTQNKMTVMNCWVNRQFRSATEIVATAPRRNLANLSRASGGAGGMLARVSAGLRRISAGIGRVSARKNDSGSQFSHTTGGVDDSDSQLPPSMHSGHGLAKTSSIGNRFGTDILSRMSIGGGGIGRQSSAVRQLAQLSRTSTFTFALNASPAPHPGTDANSNTFQLFSPLSQLLTIACCNNKAQFAAADPSADTHAMAERKVLGDATDSGLLRFCDKLVDVDGMRTAFKQVYAIPFNSKNKWALTMVEVPGDDSCYLVMIKGAPEYVMQRCTKFQHRGKEHEMNDDFKEDMNEAYQSFGMMAERVIGHAFKLVPRSSISKIPDSQEEAVAAGLVDNFTFCGLLSLIDPPRDAVPPAVETVRRAGVGVTMVTGDHPLTAEAIARKCHIITTPTRREVAAEYGVEEEQVAIDDPNVQALVVTGTMIDQLVTDDDWDKVMDKEEIVFARTTPQQKLLIVSHFQRRGEVVAVTGDGVNDSPALRRADIGVAMGNPDSSEVAREAADVVLLDDDFAALVMAIEEGRCLYDNLKKTIAYTLCHIPPETSAVIMNLLLGMPLGLGAMLVLTIDLFTEQGPASSLAFEPAEANLMDRPPRNIATERLVSFPLLTYSYFWAGIAQALCCIGAYLWTFKLNDVPASEIFWLNPKDGTWLVLPDNIERSVFIDGKEFTAEMQADIVRQANSSWYITLIVSQAWHIWVCKTRRVSIFKHPGIYTNRNTIVGVIIAITIMLLCVYIPALQEHVFYDANPPALAAWIPHFFFGAYILIFTETLKKHAREHPNDKVTKLMAW